MAPSPRILITRAPHQASALADALTALGCTPILIPTIELAPPTTFAPLDAAIAHLDTFDWLLFTSANAVEAFHHRLTHTPPPLRPKEAVILSEGAGHHPAPPSKDPEALEPAERAGNLLPPHLRIASIGPATTRAVTQLLGTEPSLVPPTAVAESLAAALLPLLAPPGQPPTRLLLARAQEAGSAIEEQLKHANCVLSIAPAYRNIIPTASIPQIQALFETPASYPAAITFTSSSTATNLLALLEVSGLTLPPEILRISIGPITTQTLGDLHIAPHVEAAEPTIQSLAGAVMQALANQSYTANS